MDEKQYISSTLIYFQIIRHYLDKIQPLIVFGGWHTQLFLNEVLQVTGLIIWFNFVILYSTYMMFIVYSGEISQRLVLNGYS